MPLDVTTGISHLEHLEDLLIHNGGAGAQLALDTIQKFVKKIKEETEDIVISEKIDGCIHPDTQVKTLDGYIKIGDLVQGDIQNQYCYGYNEADQKIEEVPILSPRKNNRGKKWVEIEFENGATMKTTEDHEFYTYNRGWVPAKELNSEDDVVEFSEN